MDRESILLHWCLVLLVLSGLIVNNNSFVCADIMYLRARYCVFYCLSVGLLSLCFFVHIGARINGRCSDML